MFKRAALALLWLSGFYFIYNIVTIYFLHLGEKWSTLPGLSNPLANKIFITIHFICGVTIMLIGPFQFIRKFRSIGIHRWNGRIYLTCCLTISLAGDMFMALNQGTAGGYMMTFTFAFNSILFIICSLFTWNYAIMGKYKSHHQFWARRTFAIGISSWVYRILYLIVGVFGHDPGLTNFRHPIDYAIDWLFFVIPLIVAEIINYKVKYIDKDIFDYEEIQVYI